MTGQLCELLLSQPKCIILRKIWPNEDEALRRSRPIFGAAAGLAGGARSLGEGRLIARVPAFHDNFNIARQSKRALELEMDQIPGVDRLDLVWCRVGWLEMQLCAGYEDIEAFLLSEKYQ